jgi:hypothetical protein
VHVASDKPYEITSGTPKASSIWRCSSTVIGAEPQRRKRSEARFAGSVRCGMILEYMVGTPVM